MWRIIPVVDATSARHENGDSLALQETELLVQSLRQLDFHFINSQTGTTHCGLEDTVTYQGAAFPLDHRIHHSESIPLYSFILSIYEITCFTQSNLKLW